MNSLIISGLTPQPGDMLQYEYKSVDEIANSISAGLVIIKNIIIG